MTEPADPLLSVLLVNWNSRDDLAACLDSLLVQPQRDLEIIVVDNGSTDGSVELVRERYPQVRLLPTGENLGFAEGCNRGIALARGRWVMTLNNDTVVRSGFVEELHRAVARAGAQVGMIQCKMLFKSRPDRTNSTGITLFPNGTARDRHFDEPDQPAADVEPIFCPTAGAALYRREMLEQVRSTHGYFDRRFFMYCEDLDLGWRCRLAGWDAIYWPFAVVEHAFQGSSRRRASDFVEWHCRKNRAATLLKNASGAFIFSSLPRTLSDLVWVVRRRGFGGVGQYLRELGEARELRAEVERVRRVPRRDVERRWVSR
jgi:GT2 family glycosyltransferase